MKLTTILCLLPLALAANCPPKPATPAEQTTLFYQFVTKFYIQKDVKLAFSDHFSPSYTEHNPDALSGWTLDGLTGLAGFIASTNLTILHAGFYNSTGWVHFRQTGGGAPDQAIVDVLRFDGSCIMEHWDVAEVKKNNSANPLALW
jgi:predicted SnoaL-like aldol condensation-catalyzing enzyme